MKREQQSLSIAATEAITRNGTSSMPVMTNFMIQSVHSGKIMTIENGSTSNAEKVKQHESYGADAQRWQLVERGNGYYQIKAKHSGKCQDVWNVSSSDGALLTQYECHPGDNQLFKLIPVQ